MLAFFLKTALFFFGLLLSGYASAEDLNEVFVLLPVHEIRFDPEGVRFDYELPCGAEKIGTLAHREASGSMRIAIVAQLPVRPCMRLGERASELLRGMDYAEIPYIQTFDQDVLLKRPRFPKVEATQHTGKMAQVVYRSACGKVLGILIQDRPEEVALGVVEINDSPEKAQPCERQALMLELGGFNYAKEPSTTPLRLKRTNLDKLYFLSIATIDESSLRQDGQKISFSFERSCNEAPVGLVQNMLADKDKNQIAVVVAHFPNQECNAGEKPLRAKYTGTLLTDKPVSIMKDSFDPFSLTLSTPANLSMSEGFSGTQIQLATYNECQKSIGVVVKRNEQTDLAVGVLQMRNEQPCKSNIKEVSFNQPLMTDLPPRRITFLSLKGE